MNLKKFTVGASAVAISCALMTTAPAWAQQAGESDSSWKDDASGQSDVAGAANSAEGEGQAIVVTGSRIGRRDLDTAAPVAVVQSEEFKLSGTVNVEQVTNTLPQVLPGTSSFSNNPGGGVATLDLRGLGANRTLVLVNDRRWMFFDTAQTVDLNTIPSFLIDSVDVVTGGASAVYGSDALGGVVNFRLRKDIDGLEVGGGYNITERGDGARYNVYGALGGEFADGRGHATVFAEYFRRKGFYAAARDFTSSVYGGEATGQPFGPSGSSTVPFGRINTPNDAIVQQIDLNGDGDTSDAGETLRQNIGSGTLIDDAVFLTPGAASARNGELYNFGPDNYLQVPQERYLIGGYANYEIGDGHEAYAEVTFVNNRVATELAATPVTGTFNINIDAVAPFLNAATLAAFRQVDANETAANAQRAANGLGPLYSGASAAANAPGVISTFIQRRVNETGHRQSLDERNAYRVLGGIRGSITDNFKYDVYYMFARTRNSNIQNGNISRSAFQAGLDGSAAPINIFGEGTLTGAMVDQISIAAQNADFSTLQIVNGAVSGTLGNLGWGGDDIGFAAGVEYRKLASRFIPDTALSSGDVIGFNAGDPTSGSYDVREVFAELRLPIVARRPLAYKLEFNGAARYSDYSLGAVGGVWTYALGGEYAPVRDITFRGQYQRAVRAPNVGELFGGQAVGFPAATDPCSTSAAAADPVIRDLCIATGVPGARVGDPTLQLNSQIQAVFGGNPNLEEEVSDSYTAGVVLRPSFIPGFSATIDWYNIKVKGSIGALGGGLNNTLNLCYNVIQDLTSKYCQAFVGTRNSDGVLDGTNPPAVLNANISELETSGIDIKVDYLADLPFSLVGDDDARLNLSFLGTYLTKADITPVSELPDQVNHCAGKFGALVCGNPRPKFRWTSRASLIDGPITMSVRWRHLGPVGDDDPDTDYYVERIPSYDVFDLSFGFDVNETLTLSAGVNNLFDKMPTLLGDNAEQSNTYPSTYDLLGRDYFISARMKF